MSYWSYQQNTSIRESLTRVSFVPQQSLFLGLWVVTNELIGQSGNHCILHAQGARFSLRLPAVSYVHRSNIRTGCSFFFQAPLPPLNHLAGSIRFSVFVLLSPIVSFRLPSFKKSSASAFCAAAGGSIPRGGGHACCRKGKGDYGGTAARLPGPPEGGENLVGSWLPVVVGGVK